MTLIGALSVSGLIAPMTWQGGTDGMTFLTYVEQVLVPTLWEGTCVVMDNFKSHHVEGVQAAITAAGAKIIYLSPYSPDFSPIENCWSKIKESLRAQAARTYDTLNEAISVAIERLPIRTLSAGLLTAVTVVKPIENRYIYCRRLRNELVTPATAQVLAVERFKL